MRAGFAFLALVAYMLTVGWLGFKLMRPQTWGCIAGLAAVNAH